MKRQPGTRVFAVCDASKSQVRLFGFGVYEGDFLMPIAPKEEDLIVEARKLGFSEEKAKEQTAQMFKVLFNNPRIKLDNGQTVWGYECWWGEETRWQEWLGQRKIINVDIEQHRKEIKK